VPLSTRDVDRQYVCAALVGGYFDSLMAFFARGLLYVRPMFEIVLGKCGAKRRAVLHRVWLLDVAGIAGG
jgi:hypothetical protein